MWHIANNRVLRLCAVSVFVLFAAALRLPAQTNGSLLSSGFGTYSRVVRLDSNRLLASYGDGAGGVQIDESDDDGVSFYPKHNIFDPDADGGDQCCATLYVLPQDAGGFPAGTVLMAESLHYNVGGAEINIWYSPDQGQSWYYHSKPATGGDGTHGVWEPEFEIAADGALVMFWSDETDPNHSQKLREVRNYGNGWQDYTDIVATNYYPDRPGMAVVRQTPSVYFMTYESCGSDNCIAHFRTSTDGWNWGDPNDLGQRVQTSDGRHFRSAPTNIWAVNPDNGGGVIAVIGQTFQNADNSTADGNGTTLLFNPNADGSGEWYTTAPPLQIYNPYTDYCPNYSSPLLQASDQHYLIGLGSAYSSPGNCQVYYNKGRLY